MIDAALGAVLRHDRNVVGAALVLTAALAWLYILWLAADMHMAGMEAGRAGSPAPEPWTAAEVGLVAVMWAVMMIGMMTPSAAPMILLYARVGRHAAAQAKPFAATGWFASGYLLIWILFALAATAAQVGLQRIALPSPMMTGANGILGGLVLIAAGLYQWTPLKSACLAHCQAPLAFIQRHGGFRRDVAGALGLGLRHGGYCVGCCWALMALLFVGGVMNVLWISAITVVVLLEKLIPAGRRISRGLGVVLVGAAAWLLISALLAAG